jgi:hypothetical protein
MTGFPPRCRIPEVVRGAGGLGEETIANRADRLGFRTFVDRAPGWPRSTIFCISR